MRKAQNRKHECVDNTRDFVSVIRLRLFINKTYRCHIAINIFSNSHSINN